jgi:hypothetical protein
MRFADPARSILFFALVLLIGLVIGKLIGLWLVR